MKQSEFLARVDKSLGIDTTRDKPKIPNLLAFLEAQGALSNPVVKEQSIESMAEQVANPQMKPTTLTPQKLSFLKRGKARIGK